MYFISKYSCFVFILTFFQISNANRLTGLLSRLLKVNQPVILVVEESQIPKIDVAKTKSQDLNQILLDYRDESQALPSSGNLHNLGLNLIPNLQNRVLLKKAKESRNVIKNRLYEPLIQQLMMLRSGCNKNIECQSECQEEAEDVDECNSDCNKKFECPPPPVEEDKCGNDCDKESSNECAESGENCQDGGGNGSTKGYKEIQNS